MEGSEGCDGVPGEAGERGTSSAAYGLVFTCFRHKQSRFLCFLSKFFILV